MQGDFSVLNFDPREHRRGVAEPSHTVLRNLSGVLQQQGRVTLDRDQLDGELFDLEWQSQAGRDIVGAGVLAVPAAEPDGFMVEAAHVVAGVVHVLVRPGRGWADGLLAYLPGTAANPTAAVERSTDYIDAPAAPLGDGERDAVMLEVSEESIHGYQYPHALIEPALGGPDTAERSYVRYAFRLVRLAPGEDCHSIAVRLADDPSSKGRLTVSLAPPTVVAGDCPVVGGGGYTGFEHHLYRIEVADSPAGTTRFKWSQWNGGLVGRGLFIAGPPSRVVIDAGRPAIIHAGPGEFYLEALAYDTLAGVWRVTYATTATLDADNDLALASPAAYGTFPATADPVFFRLWNGVAEIAAFTNVASPVTLHDGIRLVFDPPATGRYRAQDYWTFTVRAGEIGNEEVLVDAAPPHGVVYRRVPLAEIHWTGRLDTRISGRIEDCRRRFRPLINQKICCTFLIGDGVTSFGDFNSLEEAAAHLPDVGGELCLLPGIHRANLLLVNRRNVTVHGCGRRTLVLPRTATRTDPIIRVRDATGVRIHDLDLATYDGAAIVVEGTREGVARDVRIHDNRMVARTNAIRLDGAAEVEIVRNRLHLLDTSRGRATISIAADDVLVERNELVMLPFVEPEGGRPEDGGDEPPDPADPCADSTQLYATPLLLLAYLARIWTLVLTFVPRAPYRGLGGIHVRPGSERVRILENRIIGGAGNGITLGGDVDTPPPAEPVPQPGVGGLRSLAAETATVAIGEERRFEAVVQDESGRAVPDLDVYLEGPSVTTDRATADGVVNATAAPGTYAVAVAPTHRIVAVRAREANGLVQHAVVVARLSPADRLRIATRVRGFIQEVTIRENDIAQMGLSGIGFELRAGARLAAPAAPAAATDGIALLLARLDQALLQFGLTPLLVATDPVRDLVVRGNRIHHCLRNPFDERLRREALTVGRGGISLALVDAAIIAENHVYENGPNPLDPVCGVFVGYGNDLELVDNTLVANGATPTNRDQTLVEGLRGGVYVRFAGTLTTQLSTSTGRRPALRARGNRVDQPVGRALTAFAFGPVACADNHLNSELTGRSGFIDAFVGGVLILNFGGIHRYLASTLGKAANVGYTFGSSRVEFAAAAERNLPGGETLVAANFGRLGLANGSLTAQVVGAMDDLGYDGNQSSVYRGDPFFANALLLARSVRATGCRFREDVTRTLSLWSHGVDMNLTAHNQADHCILARPKPTSPLSFLPTMDIPNQVRDFRQCGQLLENPNAGTANLLATGLAAYANQLGGRVTEAELAAVDAASIGRGYAARVYGTMAETGAAAMRAYQLEEVRLEAKLGADHPRVAEMHERSTGAAALAQTLRTSAEAATAAPAAPTEKTAAISGRVVNEKATGLAGHTVELVRADGTRVATVGKTDAAGFYTVSLDEAKTAELAKERALFVRVLDTAGKEVQRSTEKIAIAPGADVRTALTVPLRPIPAVVGRTGAIVSQPEPLQPAPARGGTPLENVRGIGPATAERLRAAGIGDLEQLRATDGETLVRIFGMDREGTRTPSGDATGKDAGADKGGKETSADPGGAGTEKPPTPTRPTRRATKKRATRKK